MASNEQERELTETQLKELVAATGTSEDEAREAYRGLWKRFPKGFMTKEEFMSRFHESELFDSSYKNLYPSKYLFEVIDQNHSNTVDLYEYLWALATVQSGNPKVLLDGLFKICDTDGDGQLTQDETINVLYAFFNMLASKADGEDKREPEYTLDAIKKDMSEAFGDKTVVTKKDFMQLCEKSELMDSILRRLHMTVVFSIFDDSDF